MKDKREQYSKWTKVINVISLSKKDETYDLRDFQY